MRRARDHSLHVYPKDQEHKYHIGLKRFFDEGLTLSQIDHPNIVNVSNFFRANNTAYLVAVYTNSFFTDVLNIKFTLYVDSFSAQFIFLTAALSTIIVFYAYNYMKADLHINTFIKLLLFNL